MRLRLVTLVCAGLAVGGAAATCGGSTPFDGLLPVTLDGSVDAGHGWKARAEFILPPSFALSGTVTSLGPQGELAGTCWTGADPLTVAQCAWLRRDGGFLFWSPEPGMFYEIRGISGRGELCGMGFWKTDAGTVEGVPLRGQLDVGFGGEGRRFMPDPPGGACRALTDDGTLVGDWNQQGFVLSPDGGFVAFAYFPRPPQLPPPGYFGTSAEAVNSRNEVVGYLRVGEFAGQGNPAALYWTSLDGGSLLPNEGRPASAASLNVHGVIVGRGENAAGIPQPLMWLDPTRPPVFLPLPAGLVTGGANAINDDGLIVGDGLDDRSESHGVVWWKGGAFLADELAFSSLALHMTDLTKVNNRGQLAGHARGELFSADGGLVARPYRPVLIEIVEYPQP